MPAMPPGATLSMMAAGFTVQEGLLREVGRFAPGSQAGALVRLAVDILGAGTPSPPSGDGIVRLCRALASEGGLVREMADEIARELASYEFPPA